MSDDINTHPIALVLGASGGIGGYLARGLVARGWRVRALSRRAADAAKVENAFEWVDGDAMRAADVRQAAEGVSLIVHAVNPPGYRNWGQLVLPMLDNSIAAARATGARILLPGTVYNFGPDALPVIREDSPQHPVTVKGGIRVVMEQRLAAAATEGIGVIIVRAGDFFGPRAGNSWFSQGMLTPGKPVTSITSPGQVGIGHQWAYLPDVAETMLRLVDVAEGLPRFAVYHMRGFWDADGTQMVDAIRRVVGRPVKRRSFPWWMVPLAAPFVPFLREVREMAYLWRLPVEMQNEKLLAVLGDEPQTPIDDAVRATLTDLGCFNKTAASGR